MSEEYLDVETAIFCLQLYIKPDPSGSDSDNHLKSIHLIESDQKQLLR